MSLRFPLIFLLPILIALSSCGSSDTSDSATTAPAINTSVQSNYDNGNGELDVAIYQTIQNSYVNGEGQ